MRSILLFFLLLQLSQELSAEELWVYCDPKQQAYINVQVQVADCPHRRRRPGMMEAAPDFEARAECPKRSIIRPARHADKDYICSYPRVLESGADQSRNSVRCLNADKKHCMQGQGGVEGPGAQAIPGGAWYHLSGVSADYPDIRCQCG